MDPMLCSIDGCDKPVSAKSRLGVIEDRSFRARAQNYLTYYNAVAISRGQ
jgi:hypothetical protein